MANNIETKPKIFKKADLIIYGALAAIILSLFIIFVFMVSSSSALENVYADVDGEEIFRYDFNAKVLIIRDDDFPKNIVEDDQTITIILYFEDEYNKITINKSGSVYMEDANCSVSHDCTYMSIKKTSDTIICVPHKLHIYATKEISPTLG